MKKIILFFCISQAAFAQDSLQHVLEQVTVTANRSSTELKQTARNVSIISGETIRQLPVKSIDGILHYALNVDARTRSPFGVQTDVSIRGGQFEQTLVLIDGVKMNDPQTGHHSFNLPVPVSQIEKIEVLTGGASRVFGPAAYSGVINIITKKITQNEGNLQLGIGQFGLKQGSSFLSLAKANFQGMAAGEFLKSDGYAYNTAFQKTNIYTRQQLALGKHQLAVQGGHLKNDFGAANFYSPNYYDQFEKIQSTFLNGSLISNFTPRLQTTVLATYRQHRDFYDFDKYRFSKPDYVNHHRTKVVDIELKSRYRWKHGVTSAGLEYRQEDIVSNRLGDALGTPIPVPDNYGIFYTKGKNRQNKSVFIEEQLNLGNVTIVGGTLYNINSQYKNNWYPGIDVSWTPNRNYTIYGSTNRSLRFPTFTELYLNTATVVGNPDLLPERAWSYETGIKRGKEKLFSALTIHYRNAETSIDKILRSGQTKPEMVNLPNLHTYGIEISNQLIINQLSEKKWKLTSLIVNYAYTRVNQKAVDFQSFYTLNYLIHNLSFVAEMKIFEKLNFNLCYTFKDREGSYQKNADSPYIPYQPVHLVDSRLSWNNPNFTIFADALNLLNFRYFDYGFVAQPGRWVSTGIQLKF